MIGNCKEYEMTISICGIDVPVSQLDDIHKHLNEASPRSKEQEE